MQKYRTVTVGRWGPGDKSNLHKSGDTRAIRKPYAARVRTTVKSMTTSAARKRTSQMSEIDDKFRIW